MGNICLKIAFACTVDTCPSIWRQPMYQPECTQPLHSSLSRKIMTYSKRHICTHFQASMNSGKWTLSCQETSKLSKQCCRCSYRWPLNQGLWHSKVDKIVNNFHGQNQFHFHDQTHNFYDQYSDLCCQFFSMFIFLIWDLTNFLGQNSWSVSILSWGQDFFFSLIPKFMINPHSITKANFMVSFHRQNFVKPVPFQWQKFIVSILMASRIYSKVLFKALILFVSIIICDYMRLCAIALTTEKMLSR